ncbi:hypothetical protein OROHE_018775 [Orobanche hederae]
MKKIIKKYQNSSSKKRLVLKIVKKSKNIALRMKKSKQVQVGASKNARMRVILPEKKFKFRFSLPSSDDEDDVELDIDEYLSGDSPVTIDVKPDENNFYIDYEDAQLAFEESIVPHKVDKYSMLDEYCYDNHLFRC